MKYQAYQACADMMAPMRLFMRAAVNALSHPSLIAYPGTRQLASACEMFLSTEITHARPDFHVTSVRVEDVRNAREVPVCMRRQHMLRPSAR
jgi:poly-beta-hydroxyalkanoate depolymerase